MTVLSAGVAGFWTMYGVLILIPMGPKLPLIAAADAEASRDSFSHHKRRNSIYENIERVIWYGGIYEGHW